MNPYDNLDTLYGFLKGIRTVDEFFEKKEPAFNDEAMRHYAAIMLEDGEPEEYVLSALKANERRQFAEAAKERRSPN